MAPRGYWIAHVDVDDPEAYRAYVAANAKPFAKYGARFLVRAGRHEVFEGSSRARQIVIEFADYETALACYRSPEYEAAKRLRDGASRADLLIVEGYEGTATGSGPMTDMRLIVVGAAGRMGRTLIRAIGETPGLTVSGALEREGAAALGQDAGLVAGLPALGVAITHDPLQLMLDAEGIVDFSTPASTVALAALAAQARIAHVIGTTGLSDADGAKLEAAARHAPLVRSGNMSLGVNLLANLVSRAAAALGEDYDIEIVEMHHRMKVDAPSGTALLLGAAAARGRGVELASHSERGRDGITGPREPGAIGFASLRGGGVIGDHSVMFAGDGERITLSHQAEDRTLFARGALKAALWARGRKPGLYAMSDVLGL